MDRLLTYRGNDPVEVRNSFSRVVREEYYDGQLGCETSGLIDLCLEKAISHPISLIRVRSNFPISYRRSWQHIRENKIGVRVVWIIHRGSLKITRSGNCISVEAPKSLIVDSGRPFLAQATPDERGCFEAYQAIIPAHIFLSHLPGAVEFEGSFVMGGGESNLAGKLLNLIVDEGGNIGRDAADPLVAAFLKALSEDIVSLSPTNHSRRQRLAEKRLGDIRAYIGKNLTNPDLSYGEVAEKCGISPRYLCYLLKANATSFSTLIWSQRLPKAYDWLASSELENYPIQEIAFMAGFKSAAHFSRMFKEAYGYSPKEHRKRAANQAMMPSGAVVARPEGMQTALRVAA